MSSTTPPEGPVPGAPPPGGLPRGAVPVTDVQVNACNGETVHLTGELREDTKVHDSNVDQHIKANLTGIGNLGNENPTPA